MPLFEQPSLALTPIPRRARFKHLLPLGALYIAAREGTHTLILDSVGTTSDAHNAKSGIEDVVSVAMTRHTVVND